MHTSSLPSAARCCESLCPRFASIPKDSTVLREQAVRAGKARQGEEADQVVKAAQAVARMRVRAHPAKGAMGREALRERVRAGADRARPAGARRYGCFVTASWC